MFVDLLKQMLQFDGTKRITPGQLLKHSFITMSHIQSFSFSSSYVDSVLPPTRGWVYFMSRSANDDIFFAASPQSCFETMKAFQWVPGRNHVESLHQLSSRAVRPVQHFCPLLSPPVVETRSCAVSRCEIQHLGKYEKGPKHMCG